MDKYAVRANLKRLYTIRENDEATGTLINLGISHILRDDAWTWDLTASNGDDVTVGGQMTKAAAVESIPMVWGAWDTFKEI